MTDFAKEPVPEEELVRGKRFHFNWKLWLKIALTAIALYWVYRQVNLTEVGQYIVDAPIAITIASIVVYNVAKILGAYRLNLFFKEEGILLDAKENIKLYYKGMFYNLFLPGGVGGDAYKGYCIHKAFNLPLKKILRPILWDRVSGVAAIVFLSLVIAVFFKDLIGEHLWLAVIGGVVCLYPCFWIATRLIVKLYTRTFFSSSASALAIQVLQGLVVLLILIGMNVSNDDLGKYLFVYFISTLATTLPLTLGAIGIREVVFIKAAQYGIVEENMAVAFSVIFFAIGAFSSLAGAFIRIDLQPIGRETEVA